MQANQLMKQSSALNSSSRYISNENVKHFHSSWESNSNESNDSAFYESNEMATFKHIYDTNACRNTLNDDGKRDSLRLNSADTYSMNNIDNKSNDLEAELM